MTTDFAHARVQIDVNHLSDTLQRTRHVWRASMCLTSALSLTSKSTSHNTANPRGRYWYRLRHMAPKGRIDPSEDESQVHRPHIA